MAENYDVQAIINDLKAKEEMNADEHDGCYKLMRATVEAYSRLADLSGLDYKDLNLVYLTTVGTWSHGLDAKKKAVSESNLTSDEKEHLTMLWNEVWAKAGRGEYSNRDASAKEVGSIGLFGTGFFSFKRKNSVPTSEQVQNFIRMLIDLLPMTDDHDMFDRVEDVLSTPIPGMQTAAASMILHCLKPYSFPVLNSNMGYRNIFEIIGVQLTKTNSLETYIDNCRRIKEFRDQNLSCKNYRIFDVEARNIDGLKHEIIKYGRYYSWEIISDDIARVLCDETFFQYKGVSIPKEVFWFFNQDTSNIGQRIDLVLEYDGAEYAALIQKTDNSAKQTRIFWDSTLAKKFESYADDGKQHILEFERIDSKRFAITFKDYPVDRKTWLLTWNTDNWHWEEYSKKCEDTTSGKTVVESWTCASTTPQIGDEVFLIKLGKQPRGLIGHGSVIKESYDKEHFDPEKAAEGKTSKHIDVEFDRLINYEKDKYVSQDELNTKCSAQHWSPQNSGIEIKPEVLPTLYKLWNTITKNYEQYGFTEMVSFLAEYSGAHYIAPDKAGDKAEYMTKLKRRGQEARQKFIEFGQKVASQIPDLEYVSCSNWMNQGQIVEWYLWVELKKKEWKEYPQSVSLSIEKHDEAYPGEGYYLSIRSETRNVNSKASDFKRQLRLLDCDLIDGMTYIALHKDQQYYYHGNDKAKVKALCDDGTILKLEIMEGIENVPEKDTEGTILEETLKAAKEILPLYEYVMQPEDWWPSLAEYDPGISAEEYHDLFLDDHVIKRSWLEALYDMYRMSDHLGTCKQMGDAFGKSPGHYISHLSTIAEKVAKTKDCPLPKAKDDKTRYWPVLFQGKQLADKSQGSYCWKMREPVIDAIEKLINEGILNSIVKEPNPMIQFDHNTILYGPPGTGKTYNSVIYAVAICEGKPIEDVKKEPYRTILEKYNELREEGRIAFTTFHQSYGYEEFIEGIKPKLDEDSNTLVYRIENGVFKTFCNRAKAVKVQSTTSAQMKEHPRIWGMILGGSGMTELKKQCFENDEIRLGWGEVDDEDVTGDYETDDKASWNGKHMVFDFKNTMEVGDVVVIEKNNKSIDAIGVVTGEYVYDKALGQYPRSRAVEWLVKDIDQDMIPFLPDGRKNLSRFSLFSFDYIGMDTITGILNEHLSKNVVEIEREIKPYVFIIDEINRGNISKIFGELITLIEDTKRFGAKEAMEAVLPYSGEPFSVPKNVYILGTMNTADRSIALMDTALRRRFKFVEMMPDSKVLDDIGVGKLVIGDQELNIARMLEVINARIEYLFDREHTIGHAFFTKLKDDPSIETLASIFEKNVIPLLQEYFYEDYEKIQLVLGDNAKEDEYKFILDRPIKLKDIFSGNPDIDLPEKGYEIQHSAFKKLESYKLISKDLC